MFEKEPELYSVPLSDILKRFHDLERVYLPCPEEEIIIKSYDVNRPGLQLAGFLQFFDNNRIQVIGKSEYSYLQTFPEEELEKVMEDYFALEFPALMVTRGLPIMPIMLEKAKKYGVALYATKEPSSPFIASLISILCVKLAPRITQHGVLVEVYGEGILMLGESGVGKSETAAELLKRGHRLIADDAVEIKKVSNRTLVGTSPENIRHFLELRGIGIVNVQHLFGMGSVKLSEKIDMVVNLEPWDPNKHYDRTGLDEQHMNIMGIEIPSLTIPVKPGRNLAIILEVAAINHRQKMMGYNAAEELLARLGLER